MANFPAYKKYLAFDDDIEDGVHRTQTEGGTIKQRQRYAKTYIQSDIAFLMTTVQLEAFITWYKANKATSFNLTDPRTDTSHVYQFVDDPKWKLFSKAQKDKWTLSVNVRREL